LAGLNARAREAAVGESWLLAWVRVDEDVRIVRDLKKGP